MTVTTVEQEQCSVELTRGHSVKDGTIGVTVKAYGKTTSEAYEAALATFQRACNEV